MNIGQIESGSDVVRVDGPSEEVCSYRFMEDMHEAARMKREIIGKPECFN